MGGFHLGVLLCRLVGGGESLALDVVGSNYKSVASLDRVHSTR